MDERQTERRRLLVHERRLLRLAGWLLFFGTFQVAAGVGLTALAIAKDVPPRGTAWIMFGATQLAIGFKLRDLPPRGRVFAVLACFLVAPFIPIGTLVAIRGAIEVASSGAGEVLSERHAALRAATPDLDRERPGPAFPVIAGLLFVGALVAFWAIYNAVLAPR